MTVWHQEKSEAVLAALNTTDRGLTQAEAGRRLDENGPNRLPPPRPDSTAVIFFRQFRSPLIYLLLAAALIIFWLGELVDGAIIAAVLLLNALIGAFQEGRAQNTLAALQRLVKTQTVVLRDGHEAVLSDEVLVLGDVVILRSGDKVPADARLLLANGLKIEEAALTGESEPVFKDSAPLPAKDGGLVRQDGLPLGRQSNMVFRGTYVTAGEGRAAVVATGRRTLIGRISEKLPGLTAEVPLHANIRRLARLIVWSVLLFSAGLFALGVAAGNAPREMFAVAVALLVSAVPEGLPVVVTLVLAAGVWRMSRHQVLVKRLQAVEALGEAKVIAVDKTGTITKNQMTASRLYADGKMFTVSGIGYEPTGEFMLGGEAITPLDHPELLLAGKIAVLTATAAIARDDEKKEWQRLFGDPTEVALLVLANKLGFYKDALLREHPLLVELPFTSVTQYHAAINLNAGEPMLSVVGAPATILARADAVWRAGRVEKMTAASREDFLRALRELSAAGLRVLALAVNFHSPRAVNPENLPPLCLVSLVGISDVIRPEVKESVASAREAGMRVVMITGDFAETAKAVAREAGIYRRGDAVLLGREVEKLAPGALAERVGRTAIFAEVNPDHKLKIIQAFRARGEIVAMTGDGVNDALSLAAADLGVAMGRIGTDVAKEAADLILLDDNFGNIVLAAEEGRNIYQTIKKVILYLFSTGLGEVLTITAAIALGWPLPLFASQIIWLNLVTDTFLVLALALEPKERSLLKKSFARHGRFLLDRLAVLRMFLMGAAMVAGALWLFGRSFESDFARASTLTLSVLAVSQWLNAWNCRFVRRSIFGRQFFANRWLLGALAAVIALQFSAVYWPPLQLLLRTVPLAPADWLLVLGAASLVIWVEELRKFFARLRGRFF